MSSVLPKEKTFSSWTRDELLNYFGTKPKKQCDVLDAWLAMDEVVSPLELQVLSIFRQKAEVLMDTWKEADLRDNFLGPVISLANLYSEELHYTTFSESYISTTYRSIPLKGNVEWMVAMGFENPRTPLFFIHEYKPSFGGNDARGQLLSGMMAAQALNENPRDKFQPYRWIEVEKDMPVYGCSIVGQLWWFGVLQGNEYCFSKAYDSVDKNELIQIFKILKAQKSIIARQIQKMTKPVEPFI